MASSKVKEGDRHTYKFVMAPPQALFCYLCQLVARDPQLSVCCGTNFCRQCLEKRPTEDNGCPVCNEVDVVLTTFPNKMSDREIKKLIVLCHNSEEGCSWRNELGKLEDHVAICEMQDVECLLKCGAVLKQLRLEDHLKNECPCRQTTCEHCHVSGMHHVITDQHLYQCPKLPQSCPNDCGIIDIIRSQMDEHLKKCPLQKTACTYQNIGCKVMLSSQNQDEHDEACMKEHLQLMTMELVLAKEELVDTKLRLNRANQFTDEVRNEVMEVKVKSSRAEESLEKMRDELSSIKGEVDIAKLKISKAEQNTENMQAEFEAGLLRIQKEFHQWRKASCSVFCGIFPSLDWQNKLTFSSMLLDQCIMVAPVIIKITEVSEKIKNGKIFQSPPFNSHHSGYRVCLLVTLNGMNEHRGSQVSASISILSGPDDAKLSWPLRGQFIVSLLNQVKNSAHRVQTLGLDSMRVNKESSTARFVCNRLISHTELFAATSTCKYLVDDTMYIQVQYLSKK